jgi:hypothetical protein
MKWALLCLISLSAITWYYLPKEIVRYVHYAEKYSAKNANKNSGLKRFLLLRLHELAKLVPKQKSFPEEHITYLFNHHRWYESTNLPALKISVNSLAQLNDVISSNKDKDVIIELEDGTYRLNDSAFRINSNDTMNLLVIRAKNRHAAIIEVGYRVGFEIKRANVQLDGLKFMGVCDSDSHCEHALHIFGDADNLTIVNNEFVNFNAAIKSNGFEDKGQSRQFPDGVVVSNNLFYNQWRRLTNTPVTPIDVVGGNYWSIKHNFIADFSKDKGYKIAYGAFLKGGGENGQMHNNIIACQWKVPYSSVLDARVGLSLGGGGTGRDFCQSDACEYEHKTGSIRNNMVVNCENDVSIYLNNTIQSGVADNLLVNSLGIDISPKDIGAEIFNNKMHGSIYDKSDSLHVDMKDQNMHLGLFDIGIEEP